MTDASKKTAKANAKTLAGFDKINKLNDNSGSGSGGSGVSAGDKNIGMTVSADTDGAEEKISSFASFVQKSMQYLSDWWSTNFTPVFSDIWQNLKVEAEEFYGTLKRIFDDIKKLAQPLKEFFEGDFTVSLKTLFSSVGGMLVGLFDTFNMVFADIWDIVLFPFLSVLSTTLLPMVTQVFTEIIETATTLFNELKRIFDTLWRDVIAPVLSLAMTIWTDFIMSVKAAWDKWGKPIFDNLRTAIRGTIDTLLNYWNKYLKPIWDALVAAVTEIWSEHLKPLLDNFLDFVGEVVNGALEIYNKFILPIVNWFINKFGPPISKIFTVIVKVIKKAIARVIDIVNNIVTALKGVVQFIVGVFTGDWEKAWTGIKTYFKGIWNQLALIVTAPIEDIKELVENLKTWIGERWEDIKNFFAEIPGWFKDKFDSAWKNIKEMFSIENVRRHFFDAVSKIHSVFEDIHSWFDEKFKSAWTKITDIFKFSTIKEHFQGILKGIQDVFSNIPDWFDRKFSDAWKKVKDVFSTGGKVFDGIKDGILSSLKSVINGLIRGINKVIATPFNGINTALSRVREISIAGVQPFKGKISLINVPSIPYLATGTVVPASYGGFLAVLGDNKRETEVVSPLSTIKQALAEVLSAKSGCENINLIVELDGAVIYKTVVERNRQNTKRTGVNVLGY